MTELLIWSHAYSIGNAVVDEQHRKLVGFINTLYNIGDGPGAEAEVQQVLGELIEYTVYHFGDEERLQAESGYPGYEKHKAIHKQLIADVSAQVASLEAGDRAMREKLLVFLVDWLKEHILHDDKLVGEHMAAKAGAGEVDDL